MFSKILSKLTQFLWLSQTLTSLVLVSACTDQRQLPIPDKMAKDFAARGLRTSSKPDFQTTLKTNMSRLENCGDTASLDVLLAGDSSLSKADLTQRLENTLVIYQGNVCPKVSDYFTNRYKDPEVTALVSERLEQYGRMSAQDIILINQENQNIPFEGSLLWQRVTHIIKGETSGDMTEIKGTVDSILLTTKVPSSALTNGTIPKEDVAKFEAGKAYGMRRIADKSYGLPQKISFEQAIIDMAGTPKQ